MVEPGGLSAACEVLRGGGVVAFPTDTVYGVGASLADQAAVDRLFDIKGREHTQAIAVLVSGVDQATELADLGPDGRRLALRFWPGALTLVVARRPALTADLGGDNSTIGLRCPDHEMVREMCRRVGPLATTSANRSGEPTPVDGAGVRDVLGHVVDLVLDGVTTRADASTVVSLVDGFDVLRDGPIDAAMLRAALS